MDKPTIVTGIKPTGDLHIGNYLGMIKNAVKLQDSGKYECFCFIADYHAMTQSFTAKEMSERTYDLAIDLLSAGIDPKKSNLFIQSQISEHANLMWIFSSITSMGELQRMVEYKEKVEEGHVPNAGLFTYPVLMAADILMYKPHIVPVGDDQRQHVELTRTIARSFNKKFNKVFPEPKVDFTPTPRVMSLADPTKKMSKSQPQGCIFIHDEPKTIRKKVMAAVTDSENKIGFNLETRPGISNLIILYSEFSGMQTKDVLEKFKDAKYSEFKSALADVVIEKIVPIQKKREELLKNKKKVLKILESGAKRAREVASKTMSEVREKTGLL